MARYLIDGYNLLYAGADRWAGDKRFQMEEARARLARDIDAWCGRTASSAILVFDGVNDKAYPRLDHVKILFSGANRSADDVLRQVLLESPGGDWTLVSTDREVVSFFVKNNRKTHTSEAFVNLLFPPPPKRHKPSRELKEEPKPSYDLSPGEVDAWMKEFKFDTDNPDPPKTR